MRYGGPVKVFEKQIDLHSSLAYTKIDLKILRKKLHTVKAFIVNDYFVTVKVIFNTKFVFIVIIITSGM